MNPLQRLISRLFGHRLASIILAAKSNERFVRHYGPFDFASYRRLVIQGLGQESGKIQGVIVNMVRTLGALNGFILLPGESQSAKRVYAELCRVPPERLTTTGIMPDMDVRWDFNDSPPDFGQRFDLIVSQSMLEHLVDPYKHVCDCADLLTDEGHLIIHTMMPGFGYHRHPVDCFRFYPDWFEVVAERLGLVIRHRHIRNSRITYHLAKQWASMGHDRALHFDPPPARRGGPSDLENDTEFVRPEVEYRQVRDGRKLSRFAPYLNQAFVLFSGLRRSFFRLQE